MSIKAFHAAMMVASLSPDNPVMNMDKEIKRIKNRKPHKNRGVRIDVRTEPKIGRNQLCLCNSGNKYKHCCLNKEPKPKT